MMGMVLFINHDDIPSVWRYKDEVRVRHFVSLAAGHVDFVRDKRHRAIELTNGFNYHEPRIARRSLIRKTFCKTITGKTIQEYDPLNTPITRKVLVATRWRPLAYLAGSPPVLCDLCVPSRPQPIRAIRLIRGETSAAVGRTIVGKPNLTRIVLLPVLPLSSLCSCA